MTGSVLTINAGSSSLKFALYDNDAALTATVSGEIENLGTAPHFRARDDTGKVLGDRRRQADAQQSFADSLNILIAFSERHLDRGGPVAVGHRIVHGGAEHIVPEAVTPALLKSLEALTPFDPLHMPHNLAPIRTIAAARPGPAQVACFDTAVHHTVPRVASQVALPRAIPEAGVSRYGFHGLWGKTEPKEA
jgi:acetate kinase